jgi:hypothetical protein
MLRSGTNFKFNLDSLLAVVKGKLKTFLIDGPVLEEYLSIEKQQARLASYILNNIPIRDDMAFSTLEHLAARTIVMVNFRASLVILALTFPIVFLLVKNCGLNGAIIGMIIGTGISYITWTYTFSRFNRILAGEI